MHDEQTHGCSAHSWDSEDELLMIEQSFEEGEFEMKDVVNALVGAVLAALVCAYIFVGIAPIVLAFYAQNWLWCIVAIAVYIVNLLILRRIRKQEI